MKKTIVAIAALLVSVSAYAQGQVNFRTHIASDTPPIDFKILNADGSVGAGLYADLAQFNADGSFGVVGTTDAAALVNAAGYVTAGAATFQGLLPGSSANLVLRAWQGAAGSTYDSATIKSHSSAFNVTFNPTTVPPSPAGDLLTLGTGTLTVPEPTTLALGAVGLGALLLRRRKA